MAGPSSDKNYEQAYLAIVRDPLVYQDSLTNSTEFILQDTAEALGVARIGLWLISHNNSAMTCMSLYDVATNAFEQGAVIKQEDYPNYFKALRKGRIVDAVDAFTDPRTNELADSYLSVLDVKSLLDSTIRSSQTGGLRGVVCAEMIGEQREWTPEEKMFITSISDLLSQRLVASDGARSARAYEAVYQTSTEGIMVLDGSFFVDVNPAVCKMFGASPSDLIGKAPAFVSPEFQPDGQLSEPKAVAYITECFSGSVVQFDWVHKRLDGTEFDAEVTLESAIIDDKPMLFALLRDVTEKNESDRKAKVAQDALAFRAAHDPLTGLENRYQLHEHVSQLIVEAKNVGDTVALVILDLNRFKEINDTLGHEAGDKVLVAVTQTLNPLVTEMGGALYRLGGDEFVAAFGSNRCPEPFDNLVQTIRDHLQTTFIVDEASLSMSASVGAALFPDDGQDSHALLRCADVAMYYSKENDGASAWYQAENDVHDRRRLSMITELGQAIDDNKLVLHYQPRINIESGETTGCEALVRWNHPTLGILPPIDFLPIAEMSDLIHPLTEWVLDSAINQIKKLRALDFHIPVAINLSARNLPSSQLFDMIESRLVEHDIAPELLEVEITESALINNSKRTLTNLQRLEAIGVSIAIDDFGTGYSSLSMLKELPIDKIKIDRSFIKDMVTNDRDRVIVSSTIDLAHNFSASLVAEGVEDVETLNALAELNCEEAQGYFIAKPMPAADLEAWLASPASHLNAA